MTIKEVADRYHVSTREVDYWTNLGLIHPKVDENNKYRDYTPSAEKEVIITVIMKAAGIKLDREHFDAIMNLPQDMWEDFLVDRIKSEQKKMNRFYENALWYASRG